MFFLKLCKSILIWNGFINMLSLNMFLSNPYPFKPVFLLIDPQLIFSWWMSSCRGAPKVCRRGLALNKHHSGAQVVGGRMIGGLQMRITTEGNIDLLFPSDEKASGKNSRAAFFIDGTANTLNHRKWGKLWFVVPMKSCFWAITGKSLRQVVGYLTNTLVHIQSPTYSHQLNSLDHDSPLSLDKNQTKHPHTGITAPSNLNQAIFDHH